MSYGLAKNTLYTFGWSIVFGIVVSIILGLLVWLLATLKLSGAILAVSTVVSSLAVMIGFMYFTYAKAYSYGWSDAEEKHEVPENERLCYTKDSCEWKKMY